MTSRAIDQQSTRAITTATSTDQFGPPRVPRIEPLAPVASSASKTRRGLIGGVGVALVVRRQQRRHVDAEHAGQRAQVATGVEVAAARLEVVDLDGLDHVRADAGAVGQLVDASGPGGCGLRRARVR